MIKNRLESFYEKHNRKESMLYSMFYAYIFMLGIFSIISLWVGQYQDILVNFIAIVLSIVILQMHLKGWSLKYTAVWVLIVMEIHSGIMIASNHSNNVSIIFPFVYIAPFFFFFTMKEALFATFLQFIYWLGIVSIALMLHPNFHAMIKPLTSINNMIVTFIIMAVGIFYQLITESSYQKLQEANREKEQLLQSIHHKIRNNLNFVSSILGLQIRHINRYPNQNNIDALKNTKGRIQSMALSHRALYDAGDIIHINSKKYIQNLFTFVNEIYERDIRLICKTNNIFFLEETTHNIGLILNELFQHSLKNSDKKREIVLEIAKHDNNYLLAYQDKDMSVKLHKKNFSYKLINLIAEQIDADIIIDESLICKVSFRV